ncbi:MAG: transcriptional regulator [Candidatus Doudnabacteria bacterium CG10_big_fil_rev_8_21_14_0_10_41_10]|uniref:Transcriptional regulator n=1 Tax=Candidatus Doudnabacteria bacterium CG10_big_fil_rev_8_21_14_0_10_41_10 TaxID=1974551 RepID=A0A2H0VD76_9BACT|nr:MAG: transcriptional regulator [Candidatus Doudnabacteria bacterium CG10_big_fil_rev_8_21_14_0_10_41_10]
MAIIVEKLRQFGLDEKQISVYLSLISLGPSPVRAISLKSNVNRGTTYDILKALIKDGLVSYYQQYGKESKKQYFVAEPPEKIVSAIEKRITDLGALKDSVKAKLPELESLYEKSGAKPVSKYYEGSLGLRIILQDVISTMGEQTEKDYFVYSSADIRNYLYKAYPNYTRDRIKNKISVKVIAFGRGGEEQGLDERRWISKEHGAPTYILIYGNKVAMISVAANKDPVGVIIEDRALYETQKMIFEFTWEKLKF